MCAADSQFLGIFDHFSKKKIFEKWPFLDPLKTTLTCSKVIFSAFNVFRMKSYPRNIFLEKLKKGENSQPKSIFKFLPIFNFSTFKGPYL